MTNDRRLGPSGLTTPPLILGGNVFGWTADRAASFSILDAFIAGGGRMVDTADSYSRWVPGKGDGPGMLEPVHQGDDPVVMDADR